MRKRGEHVKLDRKEEPVDDGFSRTKSVDVSYDLIRASGNDSVWRVATKLKLRQTYRVIMVV